MLFPNLGMPAVITLIAAAAVGGGVAARPAIDKYGGTLMVHRHPAEELYGGKCYVPERYFQRIGRRHDGTSGKP